MACSIGPWLRYRTISVLSRLTGIHINPLKGQAHLSAPDPIGAVKETISHPLPLLAALALPGVGGAIGGALSSIPGVGAVGTALSHIPGATAAGKFLGLGGGEAVGGAIPDEAFGARSPISLSSILGGAKDFLTGNHGMNALGVAEGVNSALQQRKAGELGNRALASAEAPYNAKAGLRAQSLAQLAQANVGNPYAIGKPIPVSSLMAG